MTAGGRPVLGPANAPIEMIEFSDFQCPFCQRANPVVEQVLKTYGDKVKFYYKHYPLPFHPWAEPGAIAYECLKEQNPEAAWAAYKGYFENQKDVTPENVKDKGLEYAGDKKIDKAKYEDCVTNKKTKAKIDAKANKILGKGPVSGRNSGRGDSGAGKSILSVTRG